MSPQYTTLHPSSALASTSRLPMNKARQMLEQDDPRFKNLDRLLARAYLRLQRHKAQQRKAGIFTPRMDLCDDPASPFITAMLEVPGMKADQLSVRIENGRLIVEGRRNGPSLHASALPIPAQSANHARPPSDPNQAEGGADPMSAAEDAALAALYPVRELKYGKFRREIPLPTGVNAVHVRSMLMEGMLSISWPRDPSALGEQAQQVAGTPTHVPGTYAGNANPNV